MKRTILLIAVISQISAAPIASLDLSTEIKDIFPSESEIVRMKKMDINGDGALSASELEHEWILQSDRTEDEKAEYFGKIFQEFDEDFDLSLTPEEAANMMRTRYLVAVKDDFPLDFLMFDEDRSTGLELFEYIQFESKFPFTKTDPLTVEELEELEKTKTENDSDSQTDMEGLLEEDEEHEGESDRVVDDVQSKSNVEESSTDKVEREERGFDKKKVEKLPLAKNKPIAHQAPTRTESTSDDIAAIMAQIDEWQKTSVDAIRPVVPGPTRPMISFH